MSNKLIDIVNISKAFDENVVLDELNLYIRENEFFDSAGPERMRKNHDSADLSEALRHRIRGRFCFDGKDITNLPPN